MPGRSLWTVQGARLEAGASPITAEMTFVSDPVLSNVLATIAEHVSAMTDMPITVCAHIAILPFLAGGSPAILGPAGSHDGFSRKRGPVALRH